MTLRIALYVFLGVIFVVSAFAFFIPHANRGDEGAPIETSPAVIEVSFTDTYSKGSHTIAGFLMAPTPCTTLTAEASVASSTPESITLHISMPEDTGLCLQVITKLPFKVTVAAGKDAAVEAFVNGAPANEVLLTP